MIEARKNSVRSLAPFRASCFVLPSSFMFVLPLGRLLLRRPRLGRSLR